MACTTILVGKKASFDGSTMIARNDDGYFDEKKLIIVKEKKGPSVYKSKIAHLEIKIEEDAMSYSASPSIDQKNGIWAACGINSANVGMTATETITSNPRVYGADPYVKYQKASKGKKEVAGGIGEEDLVCLVLPYIHTAREGVLRLGALLEKYGTYEPNGIAFNDENEIWWLETIGGHHWMARRVKDTEYVLMPNQFGMDSFDLSDAFGKQKEHLCSKDLKEFILNNHLDLNQNGVFNPRWIFGSHSDADHVYNTPRGWYMARYFNPNTFKWDGENADFTPESDNIPWSLVPEHKITVEDVKYILSSYYQGTEYNPYSERDYTKKALYRPIGISRTGVMAICQIRPYVPEEIKAVEWICFGSNAFNAMIPLYTNVEKMPKYVSDVTLDVDSNNFYWASRLIGVLADPHFGKCIQWIERYQTEMFNEGHLSLNKSDELFIKTKDITVLAKANEEICAKAKKITQNTLNKLVLISSEQMKNGYNRADN